MTVTKTQPPPHPTNSPELVNVDTALTVLSKVNLLAESNALAIDIGGSLAKLIYLQPHKPNPRPLTIHLLDGTVATALSVHVPVLNGTLHFFAFETRNIHKLLRVVRDHWAGQSTASRHVRATGGGAYKYAQTFREEIDVTLSRLDEMKCTVAGLNFLLTSVDNEVYIYNPLPRHVTPTIPDLRRQRQFIDVNHSPFPYLLVNIGSGVSIVKVTGHDCYERISGSSLGGGTFWGLARLLLNCKTFDDIIQLTISGDNANVDMLVGDIYGGSYASLGLDSSIIAASFGKATMRADSARPAVSMWSQLRQRFFRAVSGTTNLWLSFLSAVPVLGSLLQAVGLGTAIEGPEPVATSDGEQFSAQDVALSLLRMVSYNIGQIAYLNARVHGLDRIYFGGNFIRDHPYTIADISYSVDFWSSGKMKALFMRHDGYLGAIGAFIGASSAAPTKIIDEHTVVEPKKAREPAYLNRAKKLADGVRDAREDTSSNVGQEEKREQEFFHANDTAEKCVDQNGDGDIVDTASDSVKSDLIDHDDMHLETNGGMSGMAKDSTNGSTVSSSKDSVSETPEDVDESEDKKLTNNINNNNSNASKRKRASKKGKPVGATAAEEQKKRSTAQVAVASGTAVHPSDLDDGEWTTVRIRRKGGLSKTRAS